MRQLLGHQTISVIRPTEAQGSNLGIQPGTTTVYSSIPASIQPASSSVMIFYAQRQLKVTTTIYVAGGQLTLKRGDRVTDQGGQSYAVTGWRDLSGRGKVLAIDAEAYQ